MGQLQQLQGQEVAVLPSRMWLWHGEGMVPCIVWVGRCLQRGSLCGIGRMYSENGCRAEMWWGSLGVPHLFPHPVWHLPWCWAEHEVLLMGS